MKKLLFVISIISNVVQAESVERIGSIRFNKGSVERIYLAAGMGSVVLLPCGIEEVFVGRSDDLKVQISPNDKKTLFLNLKLNASLPTNVIIKCEIDKNVFVFDVIPSKTRHQDLVEIRSHFGRPNRKDLIIQKESVPNRFVIKKPELISEGVKK